MKNFIPREHEKIATFCTRKNDVGFNLFELNKWERKEFGDNAYRITSFKRGDNDPLQWTSIIKIECKNGVKKVRFIDDNLYTQGIIKYSRSYKITVYNKK